MRSADRKTRAIDGFRLGQDRFIRRYDLADAEALVWTRRPMQLWVILEADYYNGQADIALTYRSCHAGQRRQSAVLAAMGIPAGVSGRGRSDPCGRFDARAMKYGNRGRMEQVTAAPHRRKSAFEIIAPIADRPLKATARCIGWDTHGAMG